MKIKSVVLVSIFSFFQEWKNINMWNITYNNYVEETYGIDIRKTLSIHGGYEFCVTDESKFSILLLKHPDLILKVNRI